MSHLAYLLERFFLEELQFLPVCTSGRVFVYRHRALDPSSLLGRYIPFLQTGEHITKEVEVLLGALGLEKRSDVVHLEEVG